MDLTLKFQDDFKNELKQIIKSVLNEQFQNTNKNSESNQFEEEKYLNLEEALKFLGCSKTTLYHYRRKGLIEYHQVGRKILFSKKSLLARMKVR